jgi:hypothetical protein
MFAPSLQFLNSVLLAGAAGRVWLAALCAGAGICEGRWLHDSLLPWLQARAFGLGFPWGIIVPAVLVGIAHCAEIPVISGGALDIVLRVAGRLVLSLLAQM